MAGFELKFTSEEACRDNEEKKFEYTINFLCNEEQDKQKLEKAQRINEFYKNGFHAPTCVLDNNDGCSEHVVYHGMEGCHKYDATKILTPLYDWAGAIYMTFGLILLTIGSYFLKQTLGFILYMMVSSALLTFMFTFNFVYESIMVDGSTGVIAAVVISCIIVAFPISFALYKCSKKWLVCIVGAMIGLLISYLVMTPMSPPAWIKYCVYIGNAIVGFLIFKHSTSVMIKLSTSLIGSMMFTVGLSMCISGDNRSDLEFQEGFHMDGKFWGYIAAVNFMFAVGAIIQLKYMPEINFEEHGFSHTSDGYEKDRSYYDQEDQRAQYL